MPGSETEKTLESCYFETTSDKGILPGDLEIKRTHLSQSQFWKLGKEKKTNKHKESWRDTPWCVSRLSRGNVPSVPSYVPSVPRRFCPLNWNFHLHRPKRPGCPWDVPNLSLGRFRGIPTIKFIYMIFVYRLFFSQEVRWDKKKKTQRTTVISRVQSTSFLCWRVLSLFTPHILTVPKKFQSHQPGNSFPPFLPGDTCFQVLMNASRILVTSCQTTLHGTALRKCPTAG